MIYFAHPRKYLWSLKQYDIPVLFGNDDYDQVKKYFGDDFSKEVDEFCRRMSNSALGLYQFDLKRLILIN